MKFLQSLDPRDSDYTLLLAQKAAHRLCFAVKEKKRKQKGVPRYFLKRSVLLGAAVLSAAVPHPLVWNGCAVGALAILIFA